MARIHSLNDIAKRRGQSLAQLALAWALRDPRMTSLIIGASSVEQLEDNVAALNGPPLSEEELGDIDGTVLDL
jgi:L-glyceraldehyde 3-phosphate reductase